MASFIVLHQPSFFNYPRNLWLRWSTHSQVREELGPHFNIPSLLHHLHWRIRVIHLPAPTKKKLLPWNLTYSGSPQMQTQLILPSSSTLTANHYVKHSYLPTLQRPLFVKAYPPFHQPSSSNGYQDTLTFLAMTLQTAAKRSYHNCTRYHQPYSISSVFQELFHDNPPSHIWASKFYQHHKTSTDLQQLKKPHEWFTDHSTPFWSSLITKAHHHSIDQEIVPKCPSCQQADHTLQHWLIKCPAGDATWQQVFRDHQGSLKWLATGPGDVIAFARKTLVNLDT